MATAMTTGMARRAEALLLPLVVAVGSIGVAFPGPARSLDRAGAVDPTLAALVLTAGLSVDLGGLRRARRLWVRVAAALAASSMVLPALAWALGHLVPGPARGGVLALGVAPSEVASLGLAAMAGGGVAVAAALLVGSSVVTVLAGGAILALMSGGQAVHPGALVVTLALVVALPLAVGATLRRAVPPRDGYLDAGRLLGVVALLVLLWEVAGQVELRASYLAVLGALAAFVAGASLLGGLLGWGLPVPTRSGVLLPVAMRDFAVAAGIASTAFGPRAVGPLGIYGVVVLVAGAAITRRRPSGRPRGEPGAA